MGRTLQVPTANLQTPNELIPRRGVYVTILSMEGRKYRGVTNIGFRPTVIQDETASLSIETHVLDFTQDLYGKEVILQFLVRLRDERRFSGRQVLVEQIQKDIMNGRRYFHWLERMNRLP